MACSHNYNGSCNHNHDDEDPNLGFKFSLYKWIDNEKLICLNEAEEGSGRQVFKPWDKRLDKEKFVDSDLDEELIFHITFTGSVKLKSLIVIGDQGGIHPKHVKLYKNRSMFGFEDLRGSISDQEISLEQDFRGEFEYAIKTSKFTSCEALSMYFDMNWGDDTTRIYYIGLFGEYKQTQRPGILITTYELKPNPVDHKVNQFKQTSMNVM